MPQCVFSCLLGASQFVQMVLSCLPGASLSKGIQSVLGSRPWRPPQDLPRTGPFAIEIVLEVRQNPAPFQNRDSIGNPVLQVSLVPPWCLPVCPNGSFLPPWCLAGCPIDPFLPPWCLASCQMVPSCLPGASGKHLTKGHRGQKGLPREGALKVTGGHRGGELKVTG